MTDITIQIASVAEIEALWQEHGAGLTEAQMSQTRAKLSQLETAPLAFQPRDFREEGWTKKRHIQELAAVVKEGRKLDHITVFPVAGMRLVVDGHCRLKAYRKAKLPSNTLVPVKHFTGDFGEALAAAGAQNSKDKLALTLQEKLECAWRLVKWNEQGQRWSYRDVAKMSGASKSSIENMTKALSTDCGFDPRSMTTWADVRRELRGEVEADEEWEEKLTQSWATKLRKTFGRNPEKQPTLWSQAVERAYPFTFPDDKEDGEDGESTDDSDF